MRREWPGGMSRRLAVAVTLLTVAGTGAGCASGSTGGSTPDGATIEISVDDGTVTPSGEEVQVSPGAEIDLVVTADAPGDIHVHSDPETEFSYEGTGDPETFTLSIDRPGQVEVESHTLDRLIVKLVVS